jgi:hypothetical protein
MPSSSAENNGQSGAGSDPVRRDTLPIPDIQHFGLTTYDAKDPDASYPPTERKLARVASTKPNPSSSRQTKTTDVGRETGTTVSPDYTAHTSKFTGRINWVRIDLGEDAADADHYLDPEERFRIAMARQ